MSYWDDTTTELDDKYGFDELAILSSPELDAALAPLNCAESLDMTEWLLTGIASFVGSTSTGISVEKLLIRGDDYKLHEVLPSNPAFAPLSRAFESQFTDHIMDLTADGSGLPWIDHAGVAVIDASAS